MFSESFTGKAPPEGSLLGKVLKVTWIDARTWANAWIIEDEIDKFYLRQVVSRGCVIKETQEAIYLMQSESEDEYSNLIGIPKGCISDIREIQEEKASWKS